MAELAAGAVSSLLGVLRSQAQQLQRIGHDVRFIQEEMESMRSFLEHLAKMTPSGGPHDEQVHTWMRHVRVLAHDCSSFIDSYLLRRDPAIQRARATGFRRYVWWTYWIVDGLIMVQLEAPDRLRELKERADDVGKRRLRYGVEIPSTALPSSSSSSSRPAARATLPSATGEGEDEDEDSPSKQEALVGFPALDDYFSEMIVRGVLEATGEEMQSIAIDVASIDRGGGGGSAIAHEALTRASAQYDYESTLWINLSSVHDKRNKLGVNRILCYILLHACKLAGNKEYDPDNYVDGEISMDKAREHKKETKKKIMNQIEAADVVDSKIQQLESKIKDMGAMIEKRLAEGGSNNKMVIEAAEGTMLAQADKPLGVLLLTLLDEEGRKEYQDEAGLDDEETMIEVTAGMLQKHMKNGPEERPIVLDDTQYEGILRQVFLTSCDPREATAAAAATAGDHDQIKEIRDHIKEIVHMVKQDILEEIQSSTKPHGPAAGEQNQQESTAAAPATAGDDDRIKETGDQNEGEAPVVKQEDIIVEMQPTKSHGRGDKKLALAQIARAIQDARDNIPGIKLKIKEQMVIKGIVDKINEYLQDDDTLIVLENENRRYGSKWEDIMNALRLLDCAIYGYSAVVVTTENSKNAKEFCYPTAEPITSSLVGMYYDIVLQSTGQWMSDEDSRIIRDIMERCNPHEFCMQMFARALCANPNRSSEELGRLLNDLQAPENSLVAAAKKIFKFCYKDLPREHKTCLLYLAIFPQGENLRRSTLIGRWLIEGLITKEDWPTAVRHAEQCFDALIHRGLVCPSDISAKGKFKSCMVGDIIHGFITKMAKKQHILDARLSHHLAHRFSIFSGVRLRASDSIQKFLEEFDNYAPQWSQLRLLDLQGCQYFDKKIYLQAICKRMPFLKYLSLRATNVARLPGEINKLHDLEILDIRQTKVPEKETKDLLLLKLRRLLASRNNDPSPTPSSTRCISSSVWIPQKIDKMEHMEVLSNVMPWSSSGKELKDIGELYQLRKLGVVIQDNGKHMVNLLEAIANLHDCLQSLSITIHETTKESTSSNIRKLDQARNRFEGHKSKLLESVSINGCTKRLQLLSLLAKQSNELAKVALCGTKENQLKVLANLPKLRCIRLQHDKYEKDHQLTFNEEEFGHLKYLLVDRVNITEITFKEGAAVELEKIVLSSTNVESLCGIGCLPNLKELELKDNRLFVSFSREDKAASQEGTGGEATPQESNEDEGAPLESTKYRAAPQDSSEDGAAPQENTEDEAATQESTEGGEAPQGITEDEAPPQGSTEDGVASQERIEDEQVPKETIGDGAAPREITEDEAAPQGNTEDRAAPQEITEDGADPQGDTEDGAAPQGKTERNITFGEEEFQQLKYFHLEDSEMINIIFENGAAPELEKITLSLANKKSQVNISGTSLPKLKEVKLKGDKSIFLSLINSSTSRISKVSLSDTLLNKDDLGLLAKKPNICCLELLANSYAESQLTFNKAEFSKLNLLIVKCSTIENIKFEKGSAPNLEKMVWSFTKLVSLPGIQNIRKLKQLELEGDSVPSQVRKDIEAHKNKPVFSARTKPTASGPSI